MQPGAGSIRVGVGGWTYEPWRGSFYPAGLARGRELEFASRRLTAIEINGTYYGTQKPESFSKWHAETPENFVFAAKASRHATNRRVLADSGEAIERFIGSGIAHLGAKLGPILWQFMPTKRFEPQDFEAFLALLPQSVEGRALRHVMEVRHATFRSPQYLALARRFRVATVFADTDEYPSFADVTGDLVYARLQRSRPEVATGYEAGALDAIADCARLWASGSEPAIAPRIEPPQAAGVARDVFILFIGGAKERAPAAAQALIARLGGTHPRESG
ncbi:MAG TPA: DUF72 domain-containing protein [Burkholderiaceae bacterium]|nr:DUF72 domain-containing protein [Burkholderiaceae bacterium]